MSKYQTVDEKIVPLLTLVKEEPEWAAVRIQITERALSDIIKHQKAIGGDIYKMTGAYQIAAKALGIKTDVR